MGALFGGLLSEGGAEVYLIDVNAAHVDAINNNGLGIKGYGGDRFVSVTATLEPATVPVVDVVFFQCKALYNVAAAQAAQILFERNEDCIAVSFQNGLGNEEELASVLGPERVLGGLTAMGASLEGPGVVRNYGMLQSYIGEMQGGPSSRVTELAERINGHGLPCKGTEDIRKQMWMKLFANVGHSAVSGTTNLNLNGMLAVPELVATTDAAVREAMAVAKVQGIDIDDQEAFGVIEKITGPDGTGENKSSLCHDLLNRRPTEVDYIYGPVITAGKNHGVATPVLNTLHAIVKGKESHYLSTNNDV